MARSFILENPPQNGCLNFYGEGFDQFVAQFELAQSLPYLPDIAAFEIALSKAYYAADDQALNMETLSSADPESLAELNLKPRTSVTLIQSSYPLTSIRDFCMAESQDGNLRIDQGGETLLIYRPALETQTIQLSKDEFMFIHALKAEPLGIALSKTLNAHPAFDFEAFLQKHAALETLAAFSDV